MLRTKPYKTAEHPGVLIPDPYDTYDTKLPPIETSKKQLPEG